MMDKIKGMAKALVGATVAGLSALLPVVDDGLTTSEFLAALLAALIGWQAIYWTPNKQPQD